MPGKRFSFLLSVIALCGCETVFGAPAEPDRDVRMTRGYFYFVDGAGGGGALKNYADGVHKGLIDAGYEGAGEIFDWNTGLGGVADQAASESHKRKKAAQLAKEIVAYREGRPSAPVNLMGLSAGTAVTVFTLEALPVSTQVENVILLSGTLSADYDLTSALQRVRGKMYVFTSANDAVSGYLVPIGGTADGATGAGTTIELNGPRMPRGAGAETREQYGKIVEIPWNKEFEDYGHRGGHTDVVKAPFVQAVIAPLVLASTKPVALAADLEAGEVANPDYEGWAGFAPGSWAMFEGFQEIGRRRTPIRIRTELAAVHDDYLVVNRVIEGLGDEAIAVPVIRRFIIHKTIAPENHPMLHPSSTTKEGDRGVMALGGRRLTCGYVGCVAKGTFPEWGRDPKITGLASGDVPGGFVRVTLNTKWGDEVVEIAANLKDFGIADAQ